MYFDARSAKALQPDAHIVVDGCPGLRLEATASKKTWTYRFKSPTTGQMKQRRLGAWPEMPLAAAVAKWQALKTRRDAGEDLAMSRKAEKLAAQSAPSTGYTLGRMVQDYATGYLALRREPKGAKAVALRLAKAVEKHKTMPVSLVTRRFVFDLVSALADKPVLANSVKTEMAAAWDHALDAGRIPEDLPNWWRQVLARKLRSKGAVREGKHKGTAKRVLSPDELRPLLNEDFALFSQQVRDFLTVQLWTCTRGSEIVRMHVDHFSRDADGWWWTVPKAQTKVERHASATDFRVPLEGRALAVVLRLLDVARAAGVGWLFTSTSRDGVVGPQSQAYMGTKVHYLQPYSKSRPDHVRKRLQVSHWSPHDLRRTGRTMLAAMGCPNEVGEAILGHVKPGVVGVYNQFAYDNERRQWLAALSARLEAICCGA